MIIEIRECNKHGLGKFKKPNSSFGFQCIKCASDAVSNRRRKLKKMAIDYKGGKCERCSYDKCVRSLDFHHKDPTQKDFGIAAKGLTRSWDNLKLELDKCVLICKNCHGELHEELELE